MTVTTQRSFGRGEIAPALYARTDQVGYATGLRTCRNLHVMKSGGVENRPGTTLVGAVRGNTAARLLPFVFNDAQTYVLEFSDLAVRFIRDGAYLGAPYTLTTPYPASELADLRIVQSADVVTIVHPNHPPMNLSRLGDTSWTLTTITFAPSIAAPTGLALNPPGISGTFMEWVVTAIDATTGQESLVSAPAGYSGLSGSVASGRYALSWNAVANASAYNIYKGYSTNEAIHPSDHGFVGSTGGLSFLDLNVTPDLLNRAPVTRDPFVGAGNYPTAVGYYQGRKLYADTDNTPETVYTSRSADYDNFTVSSPSQDDDALTWTLASQKVSAIQHIHTNASLLLFTTNGEWVVNGDQSGVLRPTDINALEFSRHGSSRLAPIQIDSRVLFVQARQAIIRDLKRDYYYGYLGNDLTVMSTHLFRGHQIVDWAYQENPDSIVWCVRDDGVLLGLTDVAEQQMDAWHRHDTLGSFENVCVIPEGGEDAVYVVVNRNGTRYTERFASRFFTDVRDCVFMDASLSYDGRNAGATTMTLSGGTDWKNDEPLTCTASSSAFVSGDVGNMVFLTSTDGTTLRFLITAYSSATVVTGFPTRTVPVDLRTAATTAWARAVDQVSGLSHLNGHAVSVFADGYVVASPNNPELTTVTVSGGIATLDQPYAYIHVGLPYVSDLETLAIDQSEGPTLKERKQMISRLLMQVVDSRGVFAGPSAPETDAITLANEGARDGMVEFKQRNHEDYSVPVALRTGTIEMNIPGAWKHDGHVFVRQVDPIPLSILGISPIGFVGPAT